MILKRTDNPINREGRNKLNENWETLERTYKKTVDDSSEAKAASIEAKTIALGIDGKVTEALNTANQANTKSDNAVDIATQKGNETIDIANRANNTSNYVQQQLDTVILESGDANPEVIQARADFVNLRDRLDTEFGQVTTQLAHYEKIVDGEISVLEFGADKTGVENSAQAFYDAVSFARTVAEGSDLREIITIVINAGVYKLLNQKLVIPPYVKLKTRGFVIINGEVTNDSLFHFTYEADMLNDVGFYNKQQFLRGEWLDCSQGGMFITPVTSDKTNGITAIEIGSRSNHGASKSVGRYSFSGVSIKNFNVGIKLNIYNNYLGAFHNMHIENNKTNVLFGDGSTVLDVINSGENISFYNSIFAASETAFDWFCDGMDVNFYGCSFDFNQKVFNVRKGWKVINVYGGHFEANSNCILNSALTSASNAPTLNIFGSIIHANYDTWFKGYADVLLDSIKAQSTVAKFKNLYVAEQTINLVQRNYLSQGYLYTPSSRMNRIANGNLGMVDVSGGDVTAVSGLTFGRGNFAPLVVTGNIPLNDNGYTKAIKGVSTADSGTWATIKCEGIPVASGQKVSGAAYLHVSSAIKRNVEFTVVFKDKDNATVSTHGPFGQYEVDPDTKWGTVRGLSYIAPIGAVKFDITCTIHGLQTGEEFYLVDFFGGVY